MDQYEVIIVGAGGAGLMTARMLGQQKRKVLLIDRKSDLLNVPFKTLGSFIVLDEFGLSSNVVAADINKATIHSKRIKRTAKGKAYILDKVKLHEEILSQIDTKYVTILKSTAIKSFEHNSQGEIEYVVDNNDNKYYAKIFVDASGLAGVFSKKKGLMDTRHDLAVGLEYNVKYNGDPNETHFYIGKEYQGGYGWIFPLKNGRAIVGYGSFEKQVITKLKNYFEAMLQSPQVSNLIEIDNTKSEGGSIPITDVKTKFVENNLVCVGDSVSHVNPIVGEGYRFIFKSAKYAADAIEHALNEKDNTLLSEYESNWKNEFQEKYEAAKSLQKYIGIFSKSDLITDLAVLLLYLKRDKTVEGYYAGDFRKKNLLLP